MAIQLNRPWRGGLRKLKTCVSTVDNNPVKGLEKLTAIRLAEVLTQKGAVETSAITDALYAQDKHGEPFVDLIVGGGHITEWDLVKLVVENFQLPFIMASNYDISDEAKDRIPKDVLFANLIVPLDVFDEAISVVLPIITPYQTLMKVQRQLNCELFPYIGLPSENKKVLGELYPEFDGWVKADKLRREQKVAARPAKVDKGPGDWMSIFDAGDDAIKKGLKK